MSKEDQAIVFFDQNCLLCSRSVRLLHQLDGDDRLRFAPLQGATARVFGDLLPDQAGEETAVTLLIRDGRAEVFARSEAVRVALRQCGGLSALLAIGLSVVPLPLRDAAYRSLARRRLAWFGKGEVCSLMAPDLRQKLLS